MQYDSSSAYSTATECQAARGVFLLPFQGDASLALEPLVTAVGAHGFGFVAPWRPAASAVTESSRQWKLERRRARTDLPLATREAAVAGARLVRLAALGGLATGHAAFRAEAVVGRKVNLAPTLQWWVAAVARWSGPRTGSLAEESGGAAGPRAANDARPARCRDWLIDSSSPTARRNAAV